MNKTFLSVIVLVALAVTILLGAKGLVDSAETRISNRLTSELRIVEDRIFHTQETRLAEIFNGLEDLGSVRTEGSYEDVRKEFSSLSERLIVVENKLNSILVDIGDDLAAIRTTEEIHERALPQVREVSNTRIPTAEEQGDQHIRVTDSYVNEKAVEQAWSQIIWNKYGVVADRFTRNDNKRTRLGSECDDTYLSRTMCSPKNNGVGVTYGISVGSNRAYDTETSEGSANSRVASVTHSMAWGSSIGSTKGPGMTVRESTGVSESSPGHKADSSSVNESYGTSHSTEMVIPTDRSDDIPASISTSVSHGLNYITNSPWPEGWSVACSQRLTENEHGNWARLALGVVARCLKVDDYDTDTTLEEKATEGLVAQNTTPDILLWTSSETLTDMNIFKRERVTTHSADAWDVPLLIPY